MSHLQFPVISHCPRFSTFLHVFKLDLNRTRFQTNFCASMYSRSYLHDLSSYLTSISTGLERKVHQSSAAHPPLMRTINDILPIELFFQIFHHLSAIDGPLGLGGALLVCRRWNTIILNDGHLWTNLVFNQTFIEKLGPSPIKLLNYIQRCSALSGDHFIHISVDIAAFYEHLYPGETRVQQSDQQSVAWTRLSLLTIARAMARAGSFRGRIRSIVFLGGHAPSSPLRIITSVMMDLVKERLQHLELRNCRDNAIGGIASLSRTLETVFLLDPDWEYSYAHNGLIPARQLTFQRVSSWRGEDLAHLGQYQSLTELCLIWSPIDIDGPSFVVEVFQNLTIGEYTRHSVLLPSVTTLYVKGAIPFRILDPLNLPALTVIEVRNHDSFQPLSTIHSTTLHHTITKLSVRFTPLTTDGWRGALASVLAGASQLQTLVVSRWMERHVSVSESIEIELV
jgi:hypothetical protein